MITRIVLYLRNCQGRVPIIESSSADEITDDPASTLAVVIEIHEPIRHDVRAKQYDTVVATSAMAVVLFINGHYEPERLYRKDAYNTICRICYRTQSLSVTTRRVPQGSVGRHPEVFG